MSQSQIMSEKIYEGTFNITQSPLDLNNEAWKNTKDIIINGFSLAVAGKSLLNNADLKIVHKRKYGLLGPNGYGKSSLLKMIADRVLHIPPNISMLYVEQEVVADDTSAINVVLAADEERTMLLSEEKRLLAIVDKEDDEEPEDLHEQLTILYSKIAAKKIGEQEGRARAILAGLGFDSDMQDRPTKSFSGGWRMRVSLARALFIIPDFLILDEPTNHLDLNAVIWLDNYLQSWPNTLLVVSHDQEFISNICDEIIHLCNRELHYYKGDYGKFKVMQKQKMIEMTKSWENQQKELKRMKAAGNSKKEAEKKANKKETDKAKGGKGKGGKKGKDVDTFLGDSEKVKKELLVRPKEYTVNFKFPECNELSDPILSVEDISFRYSPEHPLLFENTEFGVNMKSRISIVGNNGVGKSTLLKLICQDLSPTVGEVKVNPRLRIGRYNQHFVDGLVYDESAVDYLMRISSETKYQEARNLLGKFGLEGHAHTIKLSDCSGGQKARVVFAQLYLQKPHILVLDEPTNNLDIESIDALSDGINAFDGGVIVVSHDARLLLDTECELWILEDRDVHIYKEGYEKYREKLLNLLKVDEEKEKLRQKDKEELQSELRKNKLEKVKEHKSKKNLKI